MHFFQVIIKLSCKIQQKSICIEVVVVSRSRDGCGNLLCCINSFNFQECFVLAQSSSDKSSSLSFSLCFDDGTLFLLKGLVDYVLSSFSFLLSNLLELNSFLELISESQMGEGHIVNNNEEVLCSALKVLSDDVRHLLSLSDQLSSGVLRNHGFQDLLDD